MAGKSRFYFRIEYNWQGKQREIQDHCLAWHEDEAAEYAARRVPAGAIVTAVTVWE